MDRFTNLTTWNSHGKYYWADLDAGQKHGPFASPHLAQQDARQQSGKADLLLYGSCPDRFCVPYVPGPVCFTQEMAETYGDNRSEIRAIAKELGPVDRDLCEAAADRLDGLAKLEAALRPWIEMQSGENARILYGVVLAHFGIDPVIPD